jgi:hypothetical protein
MEAPEAALVTCKECHQIGHRAGTCLTKHTCSRCGDKERKPSECKCLDSAEQWNVAMSSASVVISLVTRLKAAQGFIAHSARVLTPGRSVQMQNARTARNCHWVNYIGRRIVPNRRPDTSAAVITLRNTARFLSLVICWLEREFWTAILQQALH